MCLGEKLEREEREDLPKIFFFFFFGCKMRGLKAFIVEN